MKCSGSSSGPRHKMVGLVPVLIPNEFSEKDGKCAEHRQRAAAGLRATDLIHSNGDIDKTKTKSSSL